MDYRPKGRVKTIKFLGENIGINLCDFELGSSFLDKTPKAQATKGNSRKKKGKQ